MIGLHISIRGNQPVEEKLKRGQTFATILKPAMKDAVLYVHSQVPPYPPAPATSTYSRTGTLGRSVTSLAGMAPGALSDVNPLSGGVIGVVGTNVKYAGYVIDRNRQAHMHKGRWWVLQDVVEKAKPGIKKILQKAVNELLK